MKGAGEYDERERRLTALRKQIEALLPYPVSHQQRCHLENALVLNLNQEDA